MAENSPRAPVRAFVTGYPVRHSRSPMIHRYWLKTLGIAGFYDAIEVEPERFPDFVKSLRAAGISGGNVTIPHKEVAFSLADIRNEAAEEIGAVNTLWFDEAGLLNGGNTDAYGFLANMDDFAPGWDLNRTALVLGAGGASRAIVYALKSRGFTEIRVVNRTLKRAAELVDHFDSRVSAHNWEEVDELVTDAGLVVNTTSLGMHGTGEIPLDLGKAAASAVVTDIVYVPLETPILRRARQSGLKTVDGLGMLLHQAVPGFEKWFGVRPDVTPELREIILSDLVSPAQQGTDA
ncbi:MAG: shikimate dehydrogenase [Phyllobacterium sp.]